MLTNNDLRARGRQVLLILMHANPIALLMLFALPTLLVLAIVGAHAAGLDVVDLVDVFAALPGRVRDLVAGTL